MTYCCGILVRDGLVMIADTRTNAGLDNVSTFRKLHVFSDPGERGRAIFRLPNHERSDSIAGAQCAVEPQNVVFNVAASRAPASTSLSSAIA